jgi:hypothetical protein
VDVIGWNTITSVMTALSLQVNSSGSSNVGFIGESYGSSNVSNSSFYNITVIGSFWGGFLGFSYNPAYIFNSTVQIALKGSQFTGFVG